LELRQEYLLSGTVFTVACWRAGLASGVLLGALGKALVLDGFICSLLRLGRVEVVTKFVGLSWQGRGGRASTASPPFSLVELLKYRHVPSYEVVINLSFILLQSALSSSQRPLLIPVLDRPLCFRSLGSGSRFAASGIVHRKRSLGPEVHADLRSLGPEVQNGPTRMAYGERQRPVTHVSGYFLTPPSVGDQRL
jgi:hypothetical protein